MSAYHKKRSQAKAVKSTTTTSGNTAIINERIIGVIQLSGITDQAISAGTFTSPENVNSWRRRGNIPQNYRENTLKALNNYLKPLNISINSQGKLVDSDNKIIPDSRRAKLFEESGIADPDSQSKTWHTHRTLMNAIEKLGSSNKQIASQLKRKANDVARWRRMARVPNTEIADISKRLLDLTGDDDVRALTKRSRSESLAGRGRGRPKRHQQRVITDQRLVELIRVSTLSYVDIAESMGLPYPTVAAWSNRESVPEAHRSDLCKLLSKNLGVKVRQDGLVRHNGKWVEWGDTILDSSEHGPTAHDARVRLARACLNSGIDMKAFNGIRSGEQDLADSIRKGVVPSEHFDAVRNHLAEAAGIVIDVDGWWIDNQDKRRDPEGLRSSALNEDRPLGGLPDSKALTVWIDLKISRAMDALARTGTKIPDENRAELADTIRKQVADDMVRTAGESARVALIMALTSETAA